MIRIWLQSEKMYFNLKSQHENSNCWMTQLAILWGKQAHSRICNEFAKERLPLLCLSRNVYEFIGWLCCTYWFGLCFRTLYMTCQIEMIKSLTQPLLWPQRGIVWLQTYLKIKKVVNSRPSGVVVMLEVLQVLSNLLSIFVYFLKMLVKHLRMYTCSTQSLNS